MEKKQDLPLITGKKLKQIISYDIVATIYKKDSTNPEQIELNSKIENLYPDIINKNTKTPPLLLRDETRQAISLNYKQASRDVCKKLGLNFVPNIESSGYEITNNDFLILEVDLAQLQLMSSEYLESPEQNLKNLLKALDGAKGSVVLFENLEHSNSVQQNMILSLITEQKYDNTILFGFKLNGHGHNISPSVISKLAVFEMDAKMPKDFDIKNIEKIRQNIDDYEKNMPKFD